MSEHHLLGLAAILIVGIIARWIAWQLHLPSILLLLICGIVAGPVTGFLRPDELFGELLLPIVSLSVGIILFEGGLSLSIRDLREVRDVVRNLVTLGVLVTWVLTAAAVHWIVGFEWILAILLGAILVVTGPTVIIPLLRHVRPSGQVRTIVKWEGILNDPIGALLAVLVYEAILAGGFTGQAEEAASLFFSSILIGCLVGVAFAVLMLLLLKFYLLPDFLQNAFSLTMVVSAFTVSNYFRAESGLLATTVMGIALANQRVSAVKHIVEFKENLRVLIISSLFIILAAKLDLSDLLAISVPGFFFLLVLLFVIRPAAVWVSCLGSKVKRPERIFLAWMAPRGIVAAAVSSIFAVRLVEAGYEDAGKFIPLAFFVIIGTVGVYGLSAFTVAKRLNLAEPEPQGVLLVGAQSWARRIALALKDAGFAVALVDSNRAHISAARLEGLKAHYGEILSEHVLDEIDMYGVGKLLAVTPHEEANSLAALHFSEIFGRKEVYQLAPDPGDLGPRRSVSAHHLSGRLAFSTSLGHGGLEELFRGGAELKSTRLSDRFDYAAFQARYDQVLPLFRISKAGSLSVVTGDAMTQPRPGETVLALVDAEPGGESGYSDETGSQSGQ